ncbi:ubiquitin-related modifier 1 isoform X3 [Erinaceus europaeus]|uniref:Ubiquitin-related modifier 1 isoform X3 n=1 Tax=Erinaceus europaeus TaxID=9365 RepID=A0ABM3Y5C5_ERIEU|nr:ubiquitin-related modifier 1 isoform X3 [Erinaceus europaeus]
MAAPLSVEVEFGGGAELLFDGIRKHQVTLPGQEEPSTDNSSQSQHCFINGSLSHTPVLPGHFLGGSGLWTKEGTSETSLSGSKTIC